MNPSEAVAFITQAAWKHHTTECTSIKIRKGNEPINDAMCDCGATRHNTQLKEALMVIGGAAKKKK